MNMLIMYMAGNSISIFPIMMVGMLFLRPVKAIIGIQSTFEAIEGSHALWQKLVYFIGHCFHWFYFSLNQVTFYLIFFSAGKLRIFEHWL